jgi:hypothetical protein
MQGEEVNEEVMTDVEMTDAEVAAVSDAVSC